MAKTLKPNPFTNLPLDNPNIFAGRENEIFYMVKALFQTAHRKPKHIFVHGERGIGKSSYVKQIELIAKGDTRLVKRLGIEIDGGDFYFVVGKHICTDGNTIEQIVNSLLVSLKEEISMLPSINIKDIEFAVEVNLGMVKTTLKTKTDLAQVNPELLNRFVSAIKKLSERVSKANRDGIVLIVDELDRVVETANYGSFFKALVERLNDVGAANVSLILVGITETMSKLCLQHASVRRIFQEIEIPLLNDRERREVVENALNEVSATVEEQVLDEVSKISDGFPAPIHVVGESIYDCDVDNYVDIEDFTKGLDNVVRYVKKAELKDKLKGAGSGRYQQILRAMAVYPDELVPVSYLNEALKVPATGYYSTNLSNLQKMDLIKQIDRGVYSLKDKLLKVYIKNVVMLERIDVDEEIF